MSEAFLCCDLTRARFLNLRDIDPAKKTGLECTTAVLVFLAFDALRAKTHMTEPVCMDAAGLDGKKSRDLLISFFAQFSTVAYDPMNIPVQVKTFGAVCVEKSSPEKRIGSNFLTTRLKIAANSHVECCYPVRPAPLLAVGKVATGIKWGVGLHADWKKNFPILLNGRVTSTPLLDLAIFLLRDSKLIIGESLCETLINGLAKTFTADLTAVFRKHIGFELKKLSLKDCYQSKTPQPFGSLDWLGYNHRDNSKPSFVLNNRIKQLEALLTLNGIALPT